MAENYKTSEFTIERNEWMKKFILAIAYSDLGWENKKTSRSSRAKVGWYVEANSSLRPSGLICICEVAGKLQM